MASVDRSLSPVLLVSMPQLVDPNFTRTVVLLAEYSQRGAFGLIVNRQMTEPACDVIKPEPPMDIQKDVHLYLGGPVEPHRAWVLTSHRELDDDALEIAEGVYLSAASGSDPPRAEELARPADAPRDRLRRLGTGSTGRRARGVGVADGAGAADLVFDTPLERMWETAIRRLGADPSALQTSSGVH